MVDIGPTVHQELDDRHLLGDGGQVRCANDSHGRVSKATRQCIFRVWFRGRGS